MGDRDSGKSVLIQVMRDGMGVADQPLQHTLLRKYLQLLQENSTLPGAICFFGSGVKMVVEGSPVLDLLQSLEARGVRLIACKTCLTTLDCSRRFAWESSVEWATSSRRNGWPTKSFHCKCSGPARNITPDAPRSPTARAM